MEVTNLSPTRLYILIINSTSSLENSSLDSLLVSSKKNINLKLAKIMQVHADPSHETKRRLS